MITTSTLFLKNEIFQKENEINIVRKNKIAIEQGKKQAEDPRLREVADDFESLFTKMLFDSMYKTLNKKDDMFYGGQAQEIFEDMLNQEYSKEMAKTGSLGISDMIVEYYSRSNVVSSSPNLNFNG